MSIIDIVWAALHVIVFGGSVAILFILTVGMLTTRNRK